MTTRGRTKSGLRTIAGPFVVAPAKGVRTRTRVHLTSEEEAAVTRIGAFLGGHYLATLADRIAVGLTTGKEQARWRAERKRALTAATSSRWAGAITRTVIDSYDLGMRGLGAHVDSLTAAVKTIGARMAAPVGGEVRDPHKPDARPVKGYKSEAERFAKSRRKAQLEARLADARERRELGRPRIVAGGGRLWRQRSCLDTSQMTREQWNQRWTSKRMFLTADGESGKRFGNETIRVTDHAVLVVKVPGGLSADLGARLSIAAPVSLSTHRGEEWADRIAGNQAIRYDLHRDQRGRWYLDASWGYGDAPTVPLASLQAQSTLGVDLNDGHADAAVIDPHGNVIGQPVRLDFRIDGTTEHRDAQVRHLVTRLVHLAKKHQCASISIENLGFADALATGRETMGRGRHGKRFRRTVAGIPTARFRTRLAAMAAAAGLSVIAVDPAYTSRWGRQHWLPALRSSDPTTDGHRAAAVVIGRRSLGHRARRKPAGPATRQRTRSGQPVGPATRSPKTSRSRVTTQPRAHDAAGPPDP
ncbi:IS605 OrfB family transposase [Cellulosimicrobium cellulans]|uniref:hypothetical protein n=1 Tax=Cellulosimicrobium cellulans TaxID=1710 RepID=UPI00195A2584|nr:hypothetical protein [Cellulosimicrobium cellulans]MBM7818070.1 IS605 OrfB family transposase [Cellulosimicrobium cellulans]